MSRTWVTRLREQCTSSAIALIPVGVTVNLAVGSLAKICKIPLYLDAIGSFIVAMLSGPVPAILTGTISALVTSTVLDPTAVAFIGTYIVVGWFAGTCADLGAARRLWTWCVCGLLTGALAACISAPVEVYLFGGVTPSGTSLVVALLIASGQQLANSVLLAGLACDPIDKLIAFFIAWLLVKGLPHRLLARFPRGAKNLSDATNQTEG